MKNGAALVYLAVVLCACLIFVVFDNNVNSQETKATDSTRISRINMINAECRENIRVLTEAKSSGKGTEISVKGVKLFIKYADKNLAFGSQAEELWKDFLQNADIEGLSSAVADKISLKKDGIESKAEVFVQLKEFLDKAIDNGYNFEF